MMNYLIEIVEVLYQHDIKRNVPANGKRMASALTIVCCFFKIFARTENIPSEYISALLSLLQLMPDVENQVCIDWDHVNELLPGTMKVTAFDATHRLILHLSHDKHFTKPEWLFALPVLHFLNGKSQPFQPIEYKPQEIPWGDRIIGLGYVKNLIRDKDIE